MTLDLDCFCRIDCLPAVNAIKEKPVPQPPSEKKHVFQENICGNLSPNTGATDVWYVNNNVHDYIQGTFEIFNADNTTPITATILTTSGNTQLNVPPSSSVATSVQNPLSF